MTKFKVGDTVEVVSGLGIGNVFPVGTVGEVVEANVAAMVKSSTPIGAFGRVSQYVSDCDLELVSGSKARPDKPLWKIVISSTGDETTARFYEDIKCPMIATVRRYHKDKYDIFTAADEAVKKLFGKQGKTIGQTEPEKPKGYTGKAMCFTDLNFQPFTKGKIYDFVDGNVVDDDGVKRPSPLNDEWSAEEKERWLNQFFIKVVE